MVHDLWVEVDINALKHNFKQIREAIPQQVKTMAVVKANGYGHGYVEPSRAFIEAGADALAVTRIEEALTIRQAGITAPILLFAPVLRENIHDAIEASLDMTITSVELVREISKAAEKQSKMPVVHVKADTGMSRLGIDPKSVLTFFEAIRSVPNVHIGGIYTHFATASEDNLEFVNSQLARFKQILQELNQQGFKYGYAHAANSAASLRLPESHFDMIRPGTLLYGQYPSAYVPKSLNLLPTWKLKARICEVKELAKGASVSYGSEYKTKQPTKTAIIPIGYADGYTLVPEGPVYRQSVIKFAAKKARRAMTVEIKGKRAPVIGRVAMQMIIVDISKIPEVEVGDEALVPAMRIPTSPLIPRVYVNQ